MPFGTSTVRAQRRPRSSAASRGPTVRVLAERQSSYSYYIAFVHFYPYSALCHMAWINAGVCLAGIDGTWHLRKLGDSDTD
eukprot:scaffold165592_cov26-Prasinocladus_malaysianus.AAC.1